MPIWSLYALVAAACSATVNVIDKTVLVKWMRRAEGSLAPFAMLELLGGLLALSILGFPILAPLDLTASILAGAAYGLAAVFYFKALKIGEVTRIIPLYDLIPILVAIFAAVFLGEVLEPIHYAAIGLVVAGTVLLSGRHQGSFKIAPGMGWMILAILATAVAAILNKYALEDAETWAVFGWGRLGSAAATLPFLPAAGKAFLSSVKRFGWPVVLATTLSEALTVVVTLLFILAAADGPVALVSALVGIHPLFLLIFAILLGRKHPDFLNESLSKGSLLRKAAATVLIIAGAALAV